MRDVTTKLKEKKVSRDPIHGYIHVDLEVVWRCIDAKEFQRLRRVRQLGSTLMVFPSGEQSRFTHSLGTYEIARRMVSEVDEISNSLTEREKVVVQLAALLHDIGHAPFSHSFESILATRHEEYTAQIIESDSEVAQVLASYDEQLPYEVASVINRQHPNPLLSQLISSQLDCDRLDYLLRDSYFAGVSYGQVDLDRILRTMRVKDGKVVVKRSSMYTIENYIMARYHMYWQVYYHPVSRSFDVILKALFSRLRDLYDEGYPVCQQFPMYEALLTKQHLSNEEFYQLDDPTCTYSFHLMRNCEDEILSDLARRILDRDLFDYAKADKQQELLIKAKEKNLVAKYYVVMDHQKQVPYLPYMGEDIWVLNDDKIEELSEVSSVVAALSSLSEEDERVFFPKELMND